MPVNIYDGTTLLDTVYVDHLTNGGQWNVLDTYTFTGTATIILRSQGSCTTSVDAVRFVQIPNEPPPPPPPPEMSIETHDTDIKWEIAQQSTAINSAISLHGADIKSGIATQTSSLATHDTDIKTALTQHDTDMTDNIVNHNANLGNHDIDIKTEITEHDANIMSDILTHDSNLGTHDTDVKAKLDAILTAVYDGSVPGKTCPDAPVARTGQITGTAAGDDGVSQRGVAWPDPRFTDNGDGTVTDNLTHLIWTQDGNLFNGRDIWYNALVDCYGLSAANPNLTDGSVVGDWSSLDI